MRRRGWEDACLVVALSPTLALPSSCLMVSTSRYCTDGHATDGRRVVRVFTPDYVCTCETQLYDQPNFMGYTIGFQGPVQIPCLDTRGWNDRIASVKVQNSIGLDSPEPLPVDRIHNVDW